MLRCVFVFAGGLGRSVQILYVNVYRVVPPPGGGGYYKSLPFTVYSIPVPMFSFAVRCFEL